MADLIQTSQPGQAGGTLYAVLYDAAGNYLDVAAGAVEAPTAAAWADYVIALTESAEIPGHFSAAFPATAPEGTYLASIRKQAGASPAVTDSEVGVGSYVWNGAAFASADLETMAETIAKLDDTLVDDGTGTYQFSADSLELAPTGSGGGGDATAANQTAILNALDEIKGATFDTATDSLEAIRDRGDASWVTATGFVVPADLANLSTFDPAVDLVTVGTNNDKSGYSLAADQSGVTVGTVNTLAGHTPQTGDTFALASGASGFAAIKSQTDAIEADTQSLQAQVAAVAGADFDEATDSLSAIRAQGDAAWTTASGFATPADLAGLSTFDPASDTVTVGDKTGFKLAADGLELVLVESDTNLREAVSVILAAAPGGVIEGAGTSNPVVKNRTGAAIRATMTVDSNGNRSAITISPYALS